MALTKVLAGEGAPHNVLVNGLLVGNIQSNQWVVRHANEGKGRSMQDFYAEMGKRIPMGRVGTAQEFANMALFWPPTPAPMSPARPSTSTAA
jgi:NAD(P)-dependent dehydrogenase (short-subunit alcohol dehydrogenase family)